MHLLPDFLPQPADIFTRIYPSYPWHFASLDGDDDDDDVIVDDDDDDLDNVIAALDIQVLKCHGVSPQQLICILKKYETFKVIPVFFTFYSEYFILFIEEPSMHKDVYFFSYLWHKSDSEEATQVVCTRPRGNLKENGNALKEKIEKWQSIKMGNRKVAIC